MPFSVRLSTVLRLLLISVVAVITLSAVFMLFWSQMIPSISAANPSVASLVSTTEGYASYMNQVIDRSLKYAVYVVGLYWLLKAPELLYERKLGTDRG